jgi:hypothetical protein
MNRLNLHLFDNRHMLSHYALMIPKTIKFYLRREMSFYLLIALLNNLNQFD